MNNLHRELAPVSDRAWAQIQAPSDEIQEGGFVLTTRGGDFELAIGQDISIAYQSHSNSIVELYLLETFTFRLLTTEAAVVLTP
jgi:uncharacterized linocin/CFP29 family protein